MQSFNGKEKNPKIVKSNMIVELSSQYLPNVIRFRISKIFQEPHLLQNILHDGEPHCLILPLSVIEELTSFDDRVRLRWAVLPDLNYLLRDSLNEVLLRLWVH